MLHRHTRLSSQALPASPPSPPPSVSAGLAVLGLDSFVFSPTGLVAVLLCLLSHSRASWSHPHLHPYPHRPRDWRMTGWAAAGAAAARRSLQEPSDRAEGGACPAALPAETQGLSCPERPPSTSQGPASLYLWHPAVGLWAREPCRQGPGPSTPTQPGPGAVSDHSAEWPAAIGAQLNMAVAGASRQAAAQVSRDARGSSARAGDRVQGGSAHQAPPIRLPGQAGGDPQGRSPGLGYLPPYSPGHPLGHSSLQACHLIPNPKSDCERSGLPAGGHPAVGPKVSFLTGWVPCWGARHFLPVRSTLFLSSLCLSSKTPSLTPKDCPEPPGDPHCRPPSGPITPRTPGTELLLCSSLGPQLGHVV